MPTAQSILTHSPDLAPIEAVTTPVDADVVVVGIAADAGAGEDAAPVVVAPHARAAAPQPASATRLWSSARSRRTRSPVLMSTGHAVTHIPSTAQVSSPA